MRPHEIDLTAPRTFVDHDFFELWRVFRTESPVHWQEATSEGPGFWSLFRYEDVLAVYRDSERFTSERGNVLSTLLRGGDSAAGKMLAVTDGARHREIRNLMLKSFSPRAMAHAAERVRVRTARLLAEVAGIGEFDFAAGVSEKIPLETICELMDVPEADRSSLQGWNKLTLSFDSDEQSHERALVARNEILLYFADLADERRRKPGDDVISALANGLVGGTRLGDDEVVLNCYSLILGGEESSRVAATGTVAALGEHPDQWKSLRDGDVGVDSAVEEALRWTTPGMHFGRRALVDVPLGEHVIAAGDVVALWNSAANLDERQFPEPTRFDVSRDPNKHLAFGYGPHFCIGAFLGRAGLRALLLGLRETVTDIDLGGPGHPILSNLVRGYDSLPVSLTAK
ncbi:cytochrome P450 [Actinosynnema sp. NPDC020468]|uniref:cytochrome P450 n=1 Tax=Actinosynnema sp. NPDC020468 TaxID=3154488 RepID=UPI0033FBA9A7